MTDQRVNNTTGQDPMSSTFGRILGTALILALTVATTGCLEDDAVEPRFTPDPGGDLFLRYVALGNSITAGFQSGGINELLQREAYPVRLAARAGADFGVPAIALPGCPPPLAAPLSGDRIADVDCAFRTSDPPMLVQNLAVPGATVLDATQVVGPSASTLTTLILGGVSQVDAMRDAEPTLVSVWLGNNDALGAAMSGDTTRLTPVATFRDAYEEIVAAIDETPAEHAVLIGVTDPIAIVPALQPGAYFWVAEQSGEAPVPLDVADNCAPGTPGGARLVSFLVADPFLAGDFNAIAVDCGQEAPFVLTQAEIAAVVTRVAAYNAIISEAAAARDWTYVDPTSAFIAPALPDPDLVRKCQGLAAATTPEEVAMAVETTCPNVEAPNFFGAYFSFDGAHPSGLAHQVIADTLAGRLNERLGLALPTGS